MTVEVLLFGPLAARAGSGRVAVEVSAPEATCAVVRRELERSHPALATALPAHRFAVNTRFVGEDEPIHDGDEVALIGMVSGG